jgi:hypothetical protein
MLKLISISSSPVKKKETLIKRAIEVAKAMKGEK